MKRVMQAGKRVLDYFTGFGGNSWKGADNYYREFYKTEELKNLSCERFQDKTIKAAINFAQLINLCFLGDNPNIMYGSMLAFEALRLGMHKFLRKNWNIERILKEERTQEHEYVELEDIRAEHDYREEQELYGHGEDFKRYF